MQSNLKHALVFLFVAVSIAILPACNQKKTSKANPLRQYILSPNIFTGYFLQDQSCQEKNIGSQSFSNIKVFEYSPSAGQSVSVTNSTIPFQALSSLTGIQVDTTYYNLHQRQDCSNSGMSDDGACTAELLLVTPPIPLKICNPAQEFKRNSVEQVGLSSLYQLEKAAAFYRRVQKQSLDKTFLSILPKIEIVAPLEDSGQVISEYVTDQMSYVRTEDGSGGFFVYPRSESVETATIWKNLNFWEWGWAVSHEYGHHVLTELSGYIGGEVSLINKKSLTERPHFMTPPIISSHFLRDQLIGNLSSRQVTSEDVIGVIHEAYADLFGFYSDGARTNALEDIDCFAFNRDVSSPNFANNLPKILGTNVMSVFNSTTNESSSRNCAVPFFQDIHTVGAIVAHGLHKVYSQKTSNNDERARLLFNWAKRLTYLKQSNLKLEDLVGDGIYVVSNNGKLTAAQCQLVSTYFPAFYGGWTSGSGKVKLTCS